MEPPGKILEQIVFNTRRKIEKHISIVLDKSTHKEHSSQPIQTNNKHFKITVTFLTSDNGHFNVNDNNFNFCSTTSINVDDSNAITIAAVA